MNALKRQFIDLAKRSGWSQAEIARKLELSRGGVNGIITGDDNPSKAMVRLFQFVLAAEQTPPHPQAVSDDSPPYRITRPDDLPVAFEELKDLLADLDMELRDELMEQFKKQAKLVLRAGKSKFV